MALIYLGLSHFWDFSEQLLTLKENTTRQVCLVILLMLTMLLFGALLLQAFKIFQNLMENHVLEATRVAGAT